MNKPAGVAISHARSYFPGLGELYSTLFGDFMKITVNLWLESRYSL